MTRKLSCYFWSPFSVELKTAIGEAVAFWQRSVPYEPSYSTGIDVIFVYAVETRMHIEVARRLKEQAIIIALISSVDALEVVRQCFQAGADMVEGVPFTPAGFQALIKRVICFSKTKPRSIRRGFAF